MTTRLHQLTWYPKSPKQPGQKNALF